MCEDVKVCGCRMVITRVYRELRRRNISDLAAFNTATTIYQMHHPEVPIKDAEFTIAEWFDEDY